MTPSATCQGSINAFTGANIPCGFGVSGLPPDATREAGLAHLSKYGNHTVHFDLNEASP